MSFAGRAAYTLWFRPLAALRETYRHGGLWAVRETERQRREMQAAADARMLGCRIALVRRARW